MRVRGNYYKPRKGTIKTLALKELLKGVAEDGQGYKKNGQHVTLGKSRRLV